MKEIITLEILPIEDDGFHLIAEATVNGLKARLLVDTGASKTVFDEQRLGAFMDAAQFSVHDKLSTGLGTNSMESKLAIIGVIAFGNIAMKAFEVAVLDLFHVNDSYQKLDILPIDGVIGGDLLVRLKARIDYSEKQMLLRQEE